MLSNFKSHKHNKYHVHIVKFSNLIRYKQKIQSKMIVLLGMYRCDDFIVHYRICYLRGKLVMIWKRLPIFEMGWGPSLSMEFGSHFKFPIGNIYIYMHLKLTISRAVKVPPCGKCLWKKTVVVSIFPCSTAIFTVSISSHSLWGNTCMQDTLHSVCSDAGCYYL